MKNTIKSIIERHKICEQMERCTYPFYDGKTTQKCQLTQNL